MSRILVIGGSDAGTMAALRARELDRAVEITIVLADAYPNFSVCGLPFHVSREVEDWRALAHRTRDEFESRQIELLPDHEAVRIDPAPKETLVRGADGRERRLRYDTVVVATGAHARVDGIENVEKPGVHTLHTVGDSLRVRSELDAGAVARAVVVGGGYIGVEMADALTRRGVRVTLASRAATVLPSVDPDLGRLVEAELARHGVEVLAGVTVREIVRSGGALQVRGAGLTRGAELVVVAAGVEPNGRLALDAGVATGVRGAIRVDRRMRTNVPGVLAAGDCVETWHRILERPTYLPLGTTAHKQGRVAGETAAGGRREFQGSLGTQVVKVFDLAVARTGLGEAEAREAGFEPVTVASTPWHHKSYYPGARRLNVHVTGDRRTGRLLGAQIVGDWRAEVAKRIDTFAAAIFHGMTIDGVTDLDLSYTPPLGAPWDAVQEAALAWVAAAS